MDSTRNRRWIIPFKKSKGKGLKHKNYMFYIEILGRGSVETQEITQQLSTNKPTYDGKLLKKRFTVCGDILSSGSILSATWFKTSILDLDI